MAKQKYIWLKMSREWGGFAIGDVVRFGESKGVERAEKGFGIQVPEPEESKKARIDAAKQVAKSEADAAKVKAAEEEKAKADDEAEVAKVKAAAEEKAKADKVETAVNTPDKEKAVGNSAARSKSKK
ncbi:hypothetical protein LCGC14_2761170 [marine sediment metagenome]|uniref:Uncharacterized protein n=1 Tax=marine sediment metagenome TaxID=412755 RepID=A0A0F8ZKS5_9ZZZZ